jgi:hypothetical protein
VNTPGNHPEEKIGENGSYFSLQVIQHDMIIPYELKKCCKKYKKGKRCKKCPAN